MTLVWFNCTENFSILTIQVNLSEVMKGDPRKGYYTYISESPKPTKFQSPLENNKTPLPPNLLKKCGFVIVLKDQTQTNNGTCGKNIIRRRLRLVSIQRPRAKPPEENRIQDKMRLGFLSIQRSREKRPEEKGIQDNEADSVSWKDSTRTQ
jgi:hypothetical protein